MPFFNEKNAQFGTAAPSDAFVAAGGKLPNGYGPTHYHAKAGGPGIAPYAPCNDPKCTWMDAPPVDAPGPVAKDDPPASDPPAAA